MNSQFANHVTSSAFTLSLHNTAITELLEMYSFEEGEIEALYSPDSMGTRINSQTIVNYLLRRGLIRRISSDFRDKDDYCLTKAGLLVSQLLMEAGFSAALQVPFRRLPRPVNPAPGWRTKEKLRERWGYDYSGLPAVPPVECQG